MQFIELHSHFYKANFPKEEAAGWCVSSQRQGSPAITGETALRTRRTRHHQPKKSAKHHAAATGCRQGWAATEKGRHGKPPDRIIYSLFALQSNWSENIFAEIVPTFEKRLSIH